MFTPLVNCFFCCLLSSCRLLLIFASNSFRPCFMLNCGYFQKCSSVNTPGWNLLNHYFSFYVLLLRHWEKKKETQALLISWIIYSLWTYVAISQMKMKRLIISECFFWDIIIFEFFTFLRTEQTFLVYMWNRLNWGFVGFVLVHGAVQGNKFVRESARFSSGRTTTGAQAFSESFKRGSEGM